MTAGVFDFRVPEIIAQTHVLVIGVDDYPHLDKNPVMGMRSVRSPHASATEFANWFLDEYQPVDTVLGSVTVLLSPGYFMRRNGQRHRVRVPTTSAISSSFKDWFWRANAHRDNLAVLYFCGHGVEPGRSFLLPADFGRDALNPWNDAIDFSSTYLGMRSCQAKTQCYFLDCCRTDSIDLRKLEAIIGRVLIPPPSGKYLARDAPRYHATRAGTPALGTVGKPSYFTTAILDCLREFGANHQFGGRWVVDTSSLQCALRERLDDYRLSAHEDLEPVTDSGESNRSTPLTYLARAPRVMTRIDCLPTAVHGLARVSFLKDKVIVASRLPSLQQFREIVPAGHYDLAIDFIGAEFTPVMRQNERVHPPVYMNRIPITSGL